MDKIIEIIKEDSRATPKDIAVMLGMTEEEVIIKIKKLEDDNIILKYTAIINEEKWNDDKVKAFIEVKVTPEREKGFDSIAERIYKFPQVSSLYLMSGGFDLLVVVEGDSLKEVAMFVSEKLSTLECVVGTSTHFLLKKYKEKGVIMSGEEEDKRMSVSP
jgi:DNA-binding Lrp family transcriptional regulator